MSIRARLGVVGKKLNGFFRRSAGWILLGAVAMALLAALGHLPRAGAQQSVQTELSPGVLRQLASLYQEQQARTPVQRKLDSQLVYRLRMRRTGRVTTEVPALRVGGRIDANEKVLLDLSATVSDELLQQIRDWGGEVINHFAQYDSIRAWLPLDSLESLASRAEVRFVRPAAEMRTHSIAAPAQSDTPSTPAPLAPPSRLARGEQIRRQLAAELARRRRFPGMPSSPAAPLVGSLTSQGDRTHQADAARTTYGVNGAGIRIGVLSDSFNALGGAAANIASGDLPGTGNPNGFTTPVTVLQDSAGTDEGRAMLQIIHDLAPGARLYFATAEGGLGNFAQNILNLRSAGCDIIVDDIFYTLEAPFQDDIVSQAVNSVTASGALYFSSAGNNGNLNDGTSTVWEGDFANGGLISVFNTPVLAHTYGGTIFNTALTATGSDDGLMLTWSDPIGASANNYDLFILDSAATSILAASTNLQTGTQDALEIIDELYPGHKILIVLYQGNPRYLRLNTLSRDISRLSIATAGRIVGHAATVGAIAVAATPSGPAVHPLPQSPTGPFPNSFNASNKVEVFSTDGPRRVFFHPDGMPITPGNFLSTGGALRLKPDLTAADGGATTVPNFSPFFGTSAAAPHAAAIAALVKSAQPSLTAAQIRSVLTASVIDIEAAGFDRDSGAGILMANAAVQAVAPSVTLAASPASRTIAPGQSTTFAITATRVNFTGSLTFSASGLPSGVTAGYSPNPTTGSSSTLTLTATAAAPAGSHIVTVSASGTGVAIAPITVTLVISAAPGCPAVASIDPASGVAGSPVTIAGAGFTGVTAVKFSNNLSAQATINSDSQITAVVPAGAVTGPITISRTGCPDAQTGVFTVSTGGGNATVSVAAASASAYELGPIPGLFRFTRTGSTAASLTVNFTLGGTAGKGTDYLNWETTAVFAAGSDTAWVTILPVNDTLQESAETVLLSLAAGTGYTIGTPGSATISIQDAFQAGAPGVWDPVDQDGQGNLLVSPEISYLDAIISNGALIVQVCFNSTSPLNNIAIHIDADRNPNTGDYRVGRVAGQEYRADAFVTGGLIADFSLYRMRTAPPFNPAEENDDLPVIVTAPASVSGGCLVVPIPLSSIGNPTAVDLFATTHIASANNVWMGEGDRAPEYGAFDTATRRVVVRRPSPTRFVHLADPAADQSNGFDLLSMDMASIADQILIDLTYSQSFNPSNPLLFPGPRGEIEFDTDRSLLTGGWFMGNQIPTWGGDLNLFYDVGSTQSPGIVFLTRPDSTGYQVEFGKNKSDGRWLGRGNILSLSCSQSLFDAFLSLEGTPRPTPQRVPTDGRMYARARTYAPNFAVADQLPNTGKAADTATAEILSPLSWIPAETVTRLDPQEYPLPISAQDFTQIDAQLVDDKLVIKATLSNWMNTDVGNLFNIWFDTDLNAATAPIGTLNNPINGGGTIGIEYGVYVNSVDTSGAPVYSAGIIRPNQQQTRNYAMLLAQPVFQSGTPGSFTVTIPLAAIGNPTLLRFYVTTARIIEGQLVASDTAPATPFVIGNCTATTISSQPANRTVCAGAPASFSVTAGGVGPFTYQWRKGGTNIPGATGSSYSIAAASAGDAGNYDVVVTGACGTATSSVAQLTVNPATSISVPPANQTVCAGAGASFTVTPAGTGPFTYQWRKGGANISGATNATYSIASTTAGDAGNYDVVVTGSCGAATSAAAVLTVNSPPVVTTSPSSAAVCAGGTASFMASATGAATTQWQVSTDGGANYANIAGATSGTLTLTNLTLGQNGNRYRAVFTNAADCATTSSAAVLMVVSCTLSSSGQSVSSGSGGGSVNVTAPGGASWTATSNAGWLGIASGSSGSGNGTVSFTIAANSGPQRTGTLTIASQTFTVDQASGCGVTVQPTNATLPAGRAGEAYAASFTASGATSPTFTISAGALPNGLELAGNGALSGTPTVFGTFNFTVLATDTNGCTGSRAYSLLLDAPCAAITITPATLASGIAGEAYSQQLAQTGGSGAIAWTISAGSPPGGVTLDSETGLLSGTPGSSGSYTFTVKATDATGCTGTQQYTLVVSGGGLQFYPLPTPIRLLDTRAGFAGCDSPGAQIPGGTARTQGVAGRTCSGLQIPATAKAITGNITTVQSGGGFLTLYPSDVTRPTVANSNYGPNQILNNVFTVGLGANDGAFNIYVTTNTDVVVDVTGYYAPPGAGGLYFHPLPRPVRLLETRVGPPAGCYRPGAPLPGATETEQQATGDCDGVTIPANARAIVGNATTVNPQGTGYQFFTLFPADATRPTVASSNYLAGQVMNGPFTVGLSPGGAFKIYPTTQTELIIDVSGYYSADAVDANGAGQLFYPLSRPVRLLETRPNFTGCYTTGAELIAESTRMQPARGVCDSLTIPANATGIIGNATVVQPQAGGWLTFWPSDAAQQPTVAASNYAAGQVFNRHFIVGVGAGDGAFKIFTKATTHLVVDLSGYFAP